MAMIPLPYGIDLFEKVRKEHCYYVDKTHLISEMMSVPFQVNLITRPRRFGKTLAMSMLASFFDIRKDSRELFEGLEISRNKDLCLQWLNQWPVLFVTLKDVNGRDFQDAYDMLRQVIANLCKEHYYLKTSDKVDPEDGEAFSRLHSRKAELAEVKNALDLLLRMMCAHYGKEVILLVDEYDVPLAKASDNGYYDEMLNVIRMLLGMSWKSNPNLKFAVVTGCLRVAKESIFTGANNFVSNSISDVRYQDCFGFTEEEVAQILADADLLEALPEVKRWYDGYRFGNMEIYCPWDVLCHVLDLNYNKKARPGNHWLDTSHNNIIRRFIDLPDMFVNDKFEILLSGGVIQERIREDLTYDIAPSSEDNLWSILYLTGYLTQVLPEELPEGMTPQEGKTSLRIPNEEVKSVFKDTVQEWFEASVKARDRSELFREWWDGEDEKLTEDVSDILFDTISYYDYKEDFYHAFVAGMFSGAGYEVKSNSEQGKGRADITIKERRRRRAIVIEAKWPGSCPDSLLRIEDAGPPIAARRFCMGGLSIKKKGATLESECQEALDQIERMQYAGNLRMEGFRTVLCYGAAFLGKDCLIRRAVEKE
ncbi:MAG: ATP-binding protein [Lachnospiraceae bacterium]|nr:ATP-binding protein [Lachnospiraceae bacterium]